MRTGFVKELITFFLYFKVKLSKLNLDDHAKKKLIKLVGERYSKDTDILTITTDRYGNTRKVSVALVLLEISEDVFSNISICLTNPVLLSDLMMMKINSSAVLFLKTFLIIV